MYTLSPISEQCFFGCRPDGRRGQKPGKKKPAREEDGGLDLNAAMGGGIRRICR